ncbi:MAG: hypothetical protein ACJA0N_001474 [Pseudohongiellaceae bacterium]|jgi:hypothetical protein
MITLNGINDSRLPKDFPLKLNDPAENLKHFARLMGSSRPDVETISYYGGHLFASIDNKKMIPLLGLEGIGVTRMETQANGDIHTYHREIGFYSDVRTGEYIDWWENPLIDDKVEIYHIKNDHVNNKMAPINVMDFDGHEIKIPFPAKWDVLGSTTVNNFELLMELPTILQKDQWPREYPGPTTKISEMFMRQFDTADLLNPKLDSIPNMGSWCRVSTWFPWMLMGELPGEVVFRTHSVKLNNGMDDIPKQLREKIEKTAPEYFKAPPQSTWGTPNESSFVNYLRDRKPVAMKK